MTPPPLADPRRPVQHSRHPPGAQGVPPQVPLRPPQRRPRRHRRQDQQAEAHHGGGRAVRRHHHRGPRRGCVARAPRPADRPLTPTRRAARERAALRRALVRAHPRRRPQVLSARARQLGPVVQRDEPAHAPRQRPHQLPEHRESLCRSLPPATDVPPRPTSARSSRSGMARRVSRQSLSTHP